MERRKFLASAAAAGAAIVTGCAGTPAQQAERSRRNDGGPVIDIHAHWHAPDFVALLEKEGGKNGAKIGKNDRGYVTLNVPGIGSVFQPQYISLETRLKAMDEIGVDIHALSLTSPMVYWAPPAFGLQLSQVYNDSLVKAHQQYPRRFVGLASLPMQEPALAAQEVERVGKLPAIRGVYIATHVNGKNLDDKSLWPVYERCEALGLHVYLHPVNPVGAERMRSYYLRNFLGNPYDTGIAASSLMFGGVMDAFPKLEVILPHAGGTYPALIGRMDHGTTVRTETKHMTKAPSTYLRRFHYDTITHHVPMMRYLIGLVGADRVVLGSDHPADMSYVRPVDFVDKLTELSARDRDLVLGGTAQRLLKI
ncbi:MAG TPA: amidohydrolase family protein [Burkholderiales bacterium]|nr:amidohydrolase family protein [Burkholderiales bacterium]